MYNYRLYYLSDGDDSNPKKYISDTKISIGEVLFLENGCYHCVVAIKEQKTGVRLDLSKSAQSSAEAILLAKQYGHY